MCDPVTMTVAATATAVAGQAYSGYQQYQAQKANAANYREQARLRGLKAESDASQAARNNRRQFGRRDALIASSGVDFSGFSDVLSDDTTEDVLQREQIIANGAAEALQLRYQADVADSKATGALIGTGLNIAGTALSGFGKLPGISASPFGGSGLTPSSATLPSFTTQGGLGNGF